MWHSQWKPAFDEIVAAGTPAQAAVAHVLEYGEREGMPTPVFYVSTAISSAGWKHDKSISGDDRIGEVIAKNNRTASLILEALVTNADPLVTGSSMMVPTDLGKVPNWKDVDYLVFYFAWMAGLNFDGAARLSDHIREAQYEDSVERANNRKLSNDARWPAYRLVTEVLLAQLGYVDSLPDTRASDGARTLVQLVDVEESLGCRAERLFADVRGLDIITPTFSAELTGDLGADVGQLRALHATVGAPRTQVELVATVLR